MSRMSIGDFAETIGKPLYDYQREIGEAILDSVLAGKGLIFTVLMARQMGKNQLSAILEAYLLFTYRQGTIIKVAPTFDPQIMTSHRRLLSILDEHYVTTNRVWKSLGWTIGLAPQPKQRDAQVGPHVLFFSASPDAHIVGATASLLLEVDEAQDVSLEKFNRDLRPMASTSNATTVLYGTAWSDQTLLAMVKARNLEMQERDGIRRHFEYDWRTLAAINPHYKTFVEKEIQQLGEEHLTIRTQYRLLPISGAGYLLNELQRHLLQGQHQWQDEPDEDDDGYYIAGLDVGGEERPIAARSAHSTVSSQGKRDSTVLTIGRVAYNDLDLPSIEVVHQYWFTGMLYADQYTLVSDIIEKWNISRLVIDATGLGETLASLLLDRFTDERITPFKFSRPTKSKLTHQLLSFINSGRLHLYERDAAPATTHNECWQQIRLARYRIPGENLLDMYVPPEDGHDDFLMSLALCCEAIKGWSRPYVDSVIIPPPPLYPEEERLWPWYRSYY